MKIDTLEYASVLNTNIRRQHWSKWCWSAAIDHVGYACLRRLGNMARLHPSPWEGEKELLTALLLGRQKRKG